jgi:hypothetical protein
MSQKKISKDTERLPFNPKENHMDENPKSTVKEVQKIVEKKREEHLSKDKIQKPKKEPSKLLMKEEEEIICESKSKKIEK